ncbi:2-deoxystreptamine glucosyltransferase [compost metagenome]
MVTAVSLLPEHQRDQVVILIAGKEPDAAQRQRVADLAMTHQVVFTGLLDDVRPVLAALDVGFVLSSRLETISFACREMMAAGKPVIVSKMGGLTENVTDGRNGWVVTPGSVSNVMATVSTILNDRGVVLKMGEEARNTALREFSLAQFVGQTELVYLEGRTPARHFGLTS